MNASQIPNLLTLSRIAAAPILILMLRGGDYAVALVVFLAAGVSDALDGWIAKRFHYTSRLGAILDPIADKILLVSSYVMLTWLDRLPFWLVLTVVFRDVLIVGGYIAYTLVVGPARMEPSRLSKANTLLQILLVIGVLVHAALGLRDTLPIDLLVYAVFFTTVASGAHYVWVWGVQREVRESKRVRGDRA